MKEEIKISPDDFKINFLDLNTEISEHPGKYAYWVFRLVNKMIQEMEIKKQMDELWISLYFSIRNKLEDNGIKVTEKYLDSSIGMNKEYLDLKNELLDVKKEIVKLERIVKIFEQRKDLLISLAANRRAEIGSKI